MIFELMKNYGDVEIIVTNRKNEKEIQYSHNTILLTGRTAMAKALANSLGGGGFQFYVTRMLFGDGGTVDGVKKFVNSNRNGLFGITRVSKPVIANLDNSVPAQVIFTSSILFDEAVGVTLNEMALQMATGDFYSMTTFPDLNKTEDIQITFNWRINFI